MYCTQFSLIRVAIVWVNLYSIPIYISIVILHVLFVAAIPINLILIDWVGRRWTLVIAYLLSALFFLLLQICTGRVGLTIIIFAIRAATAGIFNTVYIYTTEVNVHQKYIWYDAKNSFNSFMDVLAVSCVLRIVAFAKLGLAQLFFPKVN